MSLRESTRYIRNRNLWKKSSATSLRQKPRVLELRDGNTQERYSLDIAKVYRFRDPYKIELGIPGDFYVDLVNGEYEEGLIWFDNESSTTKVFDTPFTGTPYIVLETETVDFGSTVAVCIFVDETSAVVAAPTEFSGYVRYRAIYATSYPAIVSSSYSSSFMAVGGAYPMPDGSDSFSTTFPTGLLAPVSEFRVSPTFIGDIFVDPIDTMVAVAQASAVNNIDSGDLAGSVSAPLSSLNEINYLVVLGPASAIVLPPEPFGFATQGGEQITTQASIPIVTQESI